MPNSAKHILLIDRNDERRDSRIRVLESVGYVVTVRNSAAISEGLDHESRFDLIVVTLNREPEGAASYSDRLAERLPELPILLLTDFGVFVPKGTFSRSMQAGSAHELVQNVAEMLAGSSHIREI